MSWFSRGPSDKNIIRIIELAAPPPSHLHVHTLTLWCSPRVEKKFYYLRLDANQIQPHNGFHHLFSSSYKVENQTINAISVLE